MTEALLEVHDLVVTYGSRRRSSGFRALHGVTFSVAPGETVAIVGESGTGKSTLGGAVLGLVPASDGRITFEGNELTGVSDKVRRQRGRGIQAVFQNPYGSFNPSRKISDAVLEPLLADRTRSRAETNAAVVEMLAKVGLPAEIAEAYPRQLSGGQLQRVAIARALISSPKLVVLDEALSSLDLSVQAQIINLLIGLRDEMGLAYVFIGHDLDVVRHFADRVLVLYRGHIVEQGPAVEVCDHPQHPYSRDLVASVPVPDPALQRERRTARTLRGEPLTAAAPGTGCAFAPRCAYKVEVCESVRPPAVDGPQGIAVMCHRYPELFVAEPPSPAGRDVTAPAEGEPTLVRPRSARAST